MCLCRSVQVLLHSAAAGAGAAVPLRVEARAARRHLEHQPTLVRRQGRHGGQWRPQSAEGTGTGLTLFRLVCREGRHLCLYNCQ